MEFVQAYVLEEKGKTWLLEAKETRREPTLTSITIVEVFSNPQEHLIDFVGDTMLVRVLLPKTKVEKLKLEYDVLITQRMQEKCLQNLIVKHEAQFEKLQID
jgi:hypothetical protein